DRDVVLLGRRPGVDVPLPHPDVGGVHLRLERIDGQHFVVDAGAASGTWLDERRLGAGRPALLPHRARPGCGALSRGRYQAEPPADAAPTTAKGTHSIARALVRDVLTALGRDSKTTATLAIIDGPADGGHIVVPAPGKELIVGRGESCDTTIL